MQHAYIYCIPMGVRILGVLSSGSGQDWMEARKCPDVFKNVWKKLYF
jgi:hypothetical protein